MEQKKTLVIGASENPERYSYKAIQMLVQHQHPVVAIGKKAGTVAGIDFETSKKEFNHIDTVTLYVNPTHQEAYIDYILSLHPKRIIFNPGTENPKLIQLAQQHHIQPIIACTLVLLSTGQY